MSELTCTALPPARTYFTIAPESTMGTMIIVLRLKLRAREAACSPRCLGGTRAYKNEFFCITLH